jgi:iron(III) transport system substrate-binding protein
MLTRRTVTKFMLAGAAASIASRSAHAAGKVVVYTSNDQTLNRFVFEAFTKETGIDVEVVEAGSGVVFRRIASEKERPLGDIVWGVSRALLRANKALLGPYANKYADAVPAAFRDADNLWLGTNVHLLVILQNTKLVPEAEGPKTWEDLLDPKWKGKIAFTDPANSGSAYSNLTMLVELWGNNDAAWAKVGRLLANAKVLNRSSLVFQGVGNGEFPLGISLENAGYLWASNGAPVKVIYPQDGTIPQMEGVALIKGGPNAENAKLFADYVARKDVREKILGFSFRRAARGDLDLAKLPGVMPQLTSLKLLTYDEDRWVEKRAETAQKLQDLIRSTR